MTVIADVNSGTGIIDDGSGSETNEAITEEEKLLEQQEQAEEEELIQLEEEAEKYGLTIDELNEFIGEHNKEIQ